MSRLDRSVATQVLLPSEGRLVANQVPGDNPARKAMKRLLFAAAALLAALSNGAHTRDDRLPAEFVGDWCLAEHTAEGRTDSVGVLLGGGPANTVKYIPLSAAPITREKTRYRHHRRWSRATVFP